MPLNIEVTHECDICGDRHVETHRCMAYFQDYAYELPIGWAMGYMVYDVNDERHDDNDFRVLCTRCYLAAIKGEWVVQDYAKTANIP